MRIRNGACRNDPLLRMLFAIHDLVYQARGTALACLLGGLRHHARWRGNLTAELPKLESVFIVKRLKINLLFVGQASFLADTARCASFICY
jgi:hypothetical protein